MWPNWLVLKKTIFLFNVVLIYFSMYVPIDKMELLECWTWPDIQWLAGCKYPTYNTANIGWGNHYTTKSCIFRIFRNICSLPSLYKIYSLYDIKNISETTIAVPFFRCNWDSNQMPKEQWKYNVHGKSVVVFFMSIHTYICS